MCRGGSIQQPFTDFTRINLLTTCGRAAYYFVSDDFDMILSLLYMKYGQLLFRNKSETDALDFL